VIPSPLADLGVSGATASTSPRGSANWYNSLSPGLYTPSSFVTKILTNVEAPGILMSYADASTAEDLQRGVA